jgi:hypothetical protein
MADKVIGLLGHPQLWEELSDGGLDEVRDARLGLDEAARRTGEAYAVALGAVAGHFRVAQVDSGP